MGALNRIDAVPLRGRTPKCRPQRGLFPLHPGLLAAGFDHTCVHSSHLVSVSSPTSDFLLASLPTWVCPFPPLLFHLGRILGFFPGVSPSLFLASNASLFAGWSLHPINGLRIAECRTPLGTLVLREGTALYRGLFAEKPQPSSTPAL